MKKLLFETVFADNDNHNFISSRIRSSLDSLVNANVLTRKSKQNNKLLWSGDILRHLTSLGYDTFHRHNPVKLGQFKARYASNNSVSKQKAKPKKKAARGNKKAKVKFPDKSAQVEAVKSETQLIKPEPTFKIEQDPDDLIILD